MGPMIDKAQYGIVADYVEVGREEGAELIFGGQRVLAGSSALLIQEALIQELKDMIKVQADLRSGTAEWTKTLLIDPTLGGQGSMNVPGDRTRLP